MLQRAKKEGKKKKKIANGKYNPGAKTKHPKFQGAQKPLPFRISFPIILLSSNKPPKRK
jgi:hypothetical protein